MLENNPGQPIVYAQGRTWVVIIGLVSGYIAWRLAPLSYRLVVLVLRKPPHLLLGGGLWIVAILMAGVFAMCALIAALSLFNAIFPGRLTLAPNGVTFWTGRRALHFPWQSITNFRMVPLGKGTWVVGYDFAQPKASRSWLYRFSKRMGFADGDFGNNWNANGVEIVDALQRCQARWGGRQGRHCEVKDAGEGI
jgi:hypothetical protein